ncbi:Hypothetical predicted protein [Paramuricea clavata]|uniref:Uncharacterized protein n=1 Tax=Paramuricea clavata TaxID=317549 RepID=A0A7D9L0Z0_PARCT|nr:Hypothetical predicted protein [Paramuricea clavata]
MTSRPTTTGSTPTTTSVPTLINCANTTVPNNCTHNTSPSTTGASKTPTGGSSGPNCYTHQTWSDYQNGIRGFGLGASMIFLCFVEILMSLLSSACCWVATKVEPTRVTRRKATIQGTASEMIAASQSFEMVMPRRRHGRNVTSNTFNVNDNEYEMSSAGASPTSDEYESIQENVYETIPPISIPAPTHEGPITNWYSTTAC